MFRSAAALAALAAVLALAGCAAGGGIAGLGGASLPGMSRDELLSTIAACHVLRVAQTSDAAVTDATVIAAIKRYGFSFTDVNARAQSLVRDAQEGSDAMLANAANGCQRLSGATGVSSVLVRFELDGRQREIWLRIDDVEMRKGFAKQAISELRRRRAIGLVINSPGGSVYEARLLGYYLRQNGLRTAVDRVCTSACIDVLAGGVERYVTKSAKLGVHQSRVPKSYSSHEGGQLYVADSFRYLREMGVDADVAIAAASVPNNEILLIPLSVAISTRLVTGVVRGFRQ